MRANGTPKRFDKGQNAKVTGPFERRKLTSRSLALFLKKRGALTAEM